MIYSVGCVLYFSVIWLLLALASARKFYYYEMVENYDQIKLRKTEEALEKYTYDGILAYFNWNFLPFEFRFTFMTDITEAAKFKKQTQDCIICMRDIACTKLSPCQHGGLCEFCAERLLDFERGCPICARPINEIDIFEFGNHGAICVRNISR